jgi:hypothetical protein
MIRITDKNIYPIPGNPHMLHLATLSKGLRDFWVMLAVAGQCKGKCYIEEYVPTTVSWSDDIFGNFKFIQSDEEAEELTRFAEHHKLTDISERASEMCETGLGHIVFG